MNFSWYDLRSSPPHVNPYSAIIKSRCQCASHPRQDFSSVNKWEMLQRDHTFFCTLCSIHRPLNSNQLMKLSLFLPSHENYRFSSQFVFVLPRATLSDFTRKFPFWSENSNVESNLIMPNHEMDSLMDVLTFSRISVNHSSQCKFIDSRQNDNGPARKKFPKFADVKIAFKPDATSSNSYDGLIEKMRTIKSEIIIFD